MGPQTHFGMLVNQTDSFSSKKKAKQQESCFPPSSSAKIIVSGITCFMPTEGPSGSGCRGG